MIILKKKLSLFCAIAMLFTQVLSFGTVAAETETEAAIDTALVTEYGKLVVLQDFEQGSDSAMAYVDTDYMDSASIMYNATLNCMVGGVVANPDETVGGNVMNATHLDEQPYAYYHTQFNGSKMHDGKYRIVFDYYSEAEKSGFGLGWFDWSGMRNMLGDVQSNGTWKQVTYPYDLVATTDYSANEYGDATFTYGSITKVVNGTAEEPNPQVPSFGFHYSHDGANDTYTEATYIDNVKVYYFPENSYMLADSDGNPTELVEFDENVETVTLPALDGVSAWTLDGKHFYPAGYAMPTSELLGKYLTLQPFEVSTYDDTKGELLVYYDWDIEGAGINTPTYINKVYFDSIANSYVNYDNVDMTKTGVSVTDASGNQALKQYTKTNSSYGFIRTDTIMKDGLSFPASTYNVDFKFYAFKDGFDYTFAESHGTGGDVWFNNGGGKVGYTFPEGTDYDSWVPVSISHTLNDTILRSWGFTMNPASANHDTATYYDDVAIYFFPSTKVHFKASESSNVVMVKNADANGQIVVPTANELGITVDGIVTGWAATDGTTLAVGDTIDTATYAAKTYYPVVVSTNATFTYGDAGASFDLGTAETVSLPTAEDVNSEWTGDFYGWLYDGKLYNAGETVKVVDFVGKTLVAIRSEFSIPPANLSGNGKLVIYQNFEQGSDTTMAYVDTDYMTSATLTEWLARDTMKCGVVANPDEVVGGNVLDATILKDNLGVYALDFNGSKMYDGKYRVIFDYYSEAAKTGFGLGWFYYNKLREFPQVESNSTWKQVAYPELTATTADGNLTLVNSQGTEVVENTTQIPNFGFHFGHSGEGDDGTEASYIDNVRVYYFPENSYMLSGADGQLTELVEFDETQETITLPTVAGVSSWIANGEYLGAAGETVATSELLGKYATLTPLTKPTFDEELGNLVFYSDFEELEVGEYNGKFIPVSYADGTYVDGFTGFGLKTFGDVLNNVIEVNGNNVFEMRTNPNGGTGACYPQIQVWGNNTYLNLQKEGIYTFVVDAAVLEDTAGNLGIQVHSNNGSESGGSASGVNGNFETMYAQIEISAATAREALTNVLFYFGGTYEEDKYILLDNIAMYAKTGKYHFAVDADNTIEGFFAPGGNIVFPEVNVYQDTIPAGQEFDYYELDGNKYYPGDTYQTTSDETDVEITLGLKEIDYSVSFNLGTINGTLDEISANLNDTITLPTVDDESFTGWKLYGSEDILPAESTFTLTTDNLNVDEYNRIIFEAVTEGEEMVELKSIHELSAGMFTDATEEELEFIEVAYGVGVIPKAETFDRSATVTVGDVIRYAAKLYNKANGTQVDYADMAALAEYAISNGICTAYSDYNAAATFADLADILANVLPDGYYRDTYSNVITDLTGINENAKKLINVGIIDKTADMTAAVTYKDAVYAIARTIQKSLRIYDSTKTLYILGDSLCEGVGGNPGWVDKIPDFVGDRINVVNYGIGGINTGSYLESWTSRATTYYKEFLSTVKPGDYVMIALGTNDATLWSGTVENQYLSYEQSLENYAQLAKDAYFYGAQPFFVVPAGWNLTDSEGNYYPYNVEEHRLIKDCMQEASDTYGLNVPIIDFKDLSVARFGAMTAEERAEIYVDPVHYTDYGAGVVCGMFDELIKVNTDASLLTLKTCFTADTLNVAGFDELTITDYEAKQATVVAPQAYTDVTLLFASYDANDKLIDCKFIKNQTITEGTNYYPLEDFTADDANTVKVFVWDDAEGMKPLCEENETTIVKCQN